MSTQADQWAVPTEFPPAIDRPAFGTREWWLQQPELAVTILMLYRERQPAQFGAYLAEALTGTKPTGRKQQ